MKTVSPVLLSASLITLLQACGSGGNSISSADSSPTTATVNTLPVIAGTPTPATAALPVVSSNPATATAATIATTASPLTVPNTASTPPTSAPIASLTITKIELAQTHLLPPQGKSWQGMPNIADRNFHLVANREALVLVDLQSSITPMANPTLEVWNGATKQGEVALNAPTTLMSTEDSGPLYSTTAHWVKLPAAWVRPGLRVIAQNASTTSAAQTINVGAPASFIMQTLPFYLFGLSDADIPLSLTSKPDEATRLEYLAKHPFSDLQAVNHPAGKLVWPYIVLKPNGTVPALKATYKEQATEAPQSRDGFAVMSAVLDVLTALRRANGDEPLNNQYYAPLLMKNKLGVYGSPGGGLGGGSVGTGDYSYTGIFIHEAGHGFGMPHANDGFIAGTYPYAGGSLLGSAWGVDQTNNKLLPPFVPSSAKTFKTCPTDIFVLPRQMDAQNRCVKQDPMQSGAGDQSAAYKFTMFSDFNAGEVQRYFEGITSLDTKQQPVFKGGTLFLDASSTTGYSRWNSLSQAMVAASVATDKNGIYGLDAGLPTQRDVAVHAIVLTASIRIQDTFVESPSNILSYKDTITYDADTTQIYPPLSFVGNLRRTIDPTDPAQLASIKPNTSVNPWFCYASGCDYTLRVTYADNTVLHIVLQQGFKAWGYSPSIDPSAADINNRASIRTWGVNVPGSKALKKIELLETPQIELGGGVPANAKVIASRLVP